MSAATRNWLVVAIVFVAALGSVLRLESAQKGEPAVQKWEYRIHEHSGSGMEELGREGWELVAVVTTGAQGVSRELYFKRPVP